MATAVRLKQPSLVGLGPFGDRVVELLADQFSKSQIVQLHDAFRDDVDAVVLVLWRHSPQLSERADQLAHATGVPWLPIVTESSTIKVGPWVAPGVGPCYRCYWRRRIQHERDWDGLNVIYDAYDQDSALGPGGFLPHHARLSAAFAGRMLRDPTPGQVISISAMGSQVSADHVVACHGCRRCLPRPPARDLHSYLKEA